MDSIQGKFYDRIESAAGDLRSLADKRDAKIKALEFRIEELEDRIKGLETTVDQLTDELAAQANEKEGED